MAVFAILSRDSQSSLDSAMSPVASAEPVLAKELPAVAVEESGGGVPSDPSPAKLESRPPRGSFNPSVSEGRVTHRTREPSSFLISLGSMDPGTRIEFLERDERHGQCGVLLDHARDLVGVAAVRLHCSFLRFDPFVVVSPSPTWPSTWTERLQSAADAYRSLQRLVFLPMGLPISRDTLVPILWQEGASAWTRQFHHGTWWFVGDPTTDEELTPALLDLLVEGSVPKDRVPAWWREGLVIAAAQGGLGSGTPLGTVDPVHVPSVIREGSGTGALNSRTRRQAASWMAFCFSEGENSPAAEALRDLGLACLRGEFDRDPDTMERAARELFGVYEWSSIEDQWRRWSEAAAPENK